MLHFRSHASERSAEFDAAGEEAHQSQHGATMSGGVGLFGSGIFEGFSVGIVIENGAVFEPTQTDARSHLGFEVGGITPDALEVGEAGGDIESRCAVFTEVSFVEVGAPPEAFAGEIENFAIGGSGGERFVFEAAVWTPGGFRIVELDTLHSFAGKSLPGGESVGAEFGVGVVKFDEGLMVRMLGVEAGDVVVEHPFRVCHSEVLARHIALEIGEGNAAEAGDFFTETVEGFVGRSEGVIFGPVMVVPPTLLSVSVVGVAVVIGFETNPDGGVVENAGLFGDLHLLDEAIGIVDGLSFAVFASGNHPAAEGREVVTVGVGPVGVAHRGTVAFE